MKEKSKPLISKPYTDPLGIPKRVFIPEGETDLSTGIPASLDLSTLYEAMPTDFLRRLYEALHAQGLVEASDYFKPDASQRFKAAMLTVIRHDFLAAQTVAKDELNHA